MIPVAHVEELYSSVVNGAVRVEETRFADADDAYRRAFELLRAIADIDPATEIAPSPTLRGWGWLEFQPALAEILGGMEEDAFLILDVKFEHTFVQFAAQGAHGMRVEVSSNNVLPPQHHLSRPQLDRLVELGWRPPTGSLEQSTPDRDPDGSPNFFLDIPTPIDPQRLAALTVDTLVEVLQVPYPNDLTYKAFAHDGPVEHPGLKLTDVERPAPAAPVPPTEVEPETPESLRQKVSMVITGLTREVDPADADGDFVVRVGSAQVIVKVMDDMPALAISSLLLVDVTPSPAVTVTLNEFNARLRFVRLMLLGTSVIASHELHADPFDWRRVHQAILGVLHLADDLDNQLQAKIGGTLSSGEPPSSQGDVPPPGYL
jgi:hypothetical protein